MKKVVRYIPIQGWFDLSKLVLPPKKFNAYAKLQKLGAEYRKSYVYQKQFNRVQLEKLKEMCAEMSLDLILNYGALEVEPTP